MRAPHAPFSPIVASRESRAEHYIWQRRFWEHLIRDQDDLNRHINYIHYNPVKHGLVSEAVDWPYSTVHRAEFVVAWRGRMAEAAGIEIPECE
ncbi:MAG: hypothetical protein HY304_07740 [candidate division Zixibacteria bacterium]|nr:hypothetical protein [candidate division Zixibacteria bacterium]